MAHPKAERDFVRKYDTAGNMIWGKQWGTGLWDVSQAVTTDSLGKPAFKGHTAYMDSFSGTRNKCRKTSVSSF
jgi:hypothetical protein